MLYGVYFCGIHHRLFVGTGHTQIEGGDDLCTDVILAGYIDTGLKLDMVNGEACYFFHDISPFRTIFQVNNCAFSLHSIH